MPKTNLPSVCITGGAGFIGANTAAYYLKAGCHVTILDNLSRPHVRHNLDWLHSLSAGSLLKINLGDIRDLQAVRQAVTRQSLVFHFAAQTAVTTSLTDPVLDFAVNAQGTFNVLDAVRRYAPEAVVIYSSTNKVYGDLHQFPVRETKTRYRFIGRQSISEAAPLDLYTPYGCSKGIGDQYVHDYARVYGLRTLVFRQSCIYGIHQFGLEDQGWVAHFISQAIKGRPITIYGDGKQVRDLLYIDDLVRAYVLAIKAIKTTSGQIYNLGGGLEHTLSLIELITAIKSLISQPVTVNFASPRQADQKIFISDVSRAKNDFGWQPRVDVPTGLKRLSHWLQENLAV